MDINLGSIAGLGNASLSRQAAEIGREDARASSFQDELENALASGESAKMKEAARAFEAHFINMMFKQMRATIHHSGGIFERSQTEKLFQEMLDEQFAEIAAKNDGFGLAREIYEQLRRNV
ncbi:MAG: rod-binding protein [Defluviitaleaceae bacterium]|nr:rod-binding protein [Defluviitaleaceae bacterium]